MFRGVGTLGGGAVGVGTLGGEAGSVGFLTARG
jgi:hypothetical protein